MGNKENECHSFYRTATGRWIVTPEDAAFDVFGGERTPETAVEAVGGVVTQDKVVIWRDGEVRGQVQHFVRVSRGREVKDFTGRICQRAEFIIDIQPSFLDANLVSWTSRKAVNKPAFGKGQTFCRVDHYVTKGRGMAKIGNALHEDVISGRDGWSHAPGWSFEGPHQTCDSQQQEDRADQNEWEQEPDCFVTFTARKRGRRGVHGVMFGNEKGEVKGGPLKTRTGAKGDNGGNRGNIEVGCTDGPIGEKSNIERGNDREHL